MRLCEFCGAELVRHPKHSRAQWENKRFCDRACAGGASRKDRRCCCGCGESPLPRRRYVRGHRPLKLTAQGYRQVEPDSYQWRDKPDNYVIWMFAWLGALPGDELVDVFGQKPEAFCLEKRAGRRALAKAEYPSLLAEESA